MRRPPDRASSSLQAPELPLDELQTIAFAPVERLHFDPQNPRLPSTVDGNNEQAVLEWMLQDGTIIELMGSIGEQGYFPGEPLLVEPASEPNSYVVVEGNRRLTAVKLLLNPELAPTRKQTVLAISESAEHKPTELPVLIYRQREQILAYLGYRHITGVKAWPPLAKAKYLRQLLIHQPGLSYQDLARTIGSRADYAERLLTGLAVYDAIAEEAFFGIAGLNERSVDFSVLTTALNYSNIATFLNLTDPSDIRLPGLDLRRLRELTTWLFQRNAEGQTRLGESRNLKQLSAVVANEQALQAFRNGRPLRDAVALAETPTNVFRAAIFDARIRLQEARDQLGFFDEVSQDDVDLLSEVMRLARDLRVIVENRLFGE